MSSSITRRLAIWLALPITAVVMLGSVTDYYINIAEELAHDEQRLNRTLDLLAEHARETGQSWSPDAAELLRVPSTASGGVRYAVRDAQQRLIAGDATLPIIRQIQSAQRLRTLMTNDDVYLQLLTQRLNLAKGSVTITVGKAADTSWSSMRLGLTGKLLWDFIVLDLILILAWIGVKTGLRPLRDLRDRLAERSPQDLRPIPEASAPKELAPLISTLNRLFVVVQGSITSQKQLVASTAHQLRTPITGINAQLELLLADPAATPIKDRLMTLQEGVQHLARSTNQLLALARADAASTVVVQNKPINLQVLIGDIATKFVDRAIAASIDLGVEAQPVWLKVDATLLDDLLSNLIDNALKYTKHGGTVTVSNGIDAGHPYIEVADNGIGIAESEYQQIRQRYYRSPNSPGHGTGLGLAIVDEITRFYGGELTFERGENDQGTKVRVRLPDWLVTAERP